MSMTATTSKKWLQLLQAVATDTVVIVVVYFLALNFRYWGTVSGWTPWTLDFLIFAVMAVIVHLLSNILFDTYRLIPRAVSLGAALRVAMAAFTAMVVLTLAVVLWPTLRGHPEYLVPRSVVLGGGVVSIAALVGWRFVPRAAEELGNRSKSGTTRVLLVGAGRGADALLRELIRTPETGITVVGLVDDDPALHGMHLHGYRVLGPVEDVPAIVARKQVNEIVLAVPSATADQMARIYRLCRSARVPIKTIPSLRDLVTGRVSIAQTRELDVKDLLGRPVVTTDLRGISCHFEGNTILVTGAAGSIGSELCRQLAQCRPARLLLVDHNESGLYELCEELGRAGFKETRPCPLNILEADKLNRLFAAQRPTHVFHAAAYKHVPLMELNPDEAIMNNILGTKLVATAAGEHEVGWFVNISTDKAVEPVSVMGATKWAGELLVASLGTQFPRTSFASVRFGNVLGSRGSVVPLFARQIESGGPVTVTHPGMTRYFMLIEEAVQLVLQAAALTDGPTPPEDHDPRTFVLNMGAPVAIVEVARRMIDFYADRRGGPVEIVYSGLRPGERLEERLTWPFEKITPTRQPLLGRIRWSEEAYHLVRDYSTLMMSLNAIIDAAKAHTPREELICLMADLLPGYTPSMAQALV